MKVWEMGDTLLIFCTGSVIGRTQVKLSIMGSKLLPMSYEVHGLKHGGMPEGMMEIGGAWKGA